METQNVLIIGGGPAGTASALNLIQSGLKPVIVECDEFPRYHIGESLTTECVDALERLGLEEDLAGLAAPRKNGVRIFSRNPETSFYVGAGDAWQVERALFDQMMLDVALSRGAGFISGKVTSIAKKEDVWEVVIENGKETRAVQTRFLIDASGQNRLTHRLGLWGALKSGDYARQIAFFSQFENVNNQPQDNKDTLIFHREHHQWCWLIPLSESITSAGLVVSVDEYKRQKSKPENFYLENITTFSDPLALRLKDARHSGQVRTVSNYSYTIDNYAEDGLYCVGDSHRFIDPIFSFGVEFAVKEAEYVAKAIVNSLGSERSKWSLYEMEYVEVTTQAQNIISDMLAYFWKHPWGFANMAHVRHKQEFLELFAGRIYQVQPGPGLLKMRAALG